MDEYSGKEAGDGFVVSKKGSSLVLRDNANNRDRNAPFGNRIGCNVRLNSGKASQINNSEKAKSARTVFRPSSNGKEVVGSSSRSCSATYKPRKSFPEPQTKLSSLVETDSSETGSVLDEPEIPELIPPPGKVQRSLHLESEEAASGETVSIEEGSSSAATSTKSRRSFHKKLDIPNIVANSPVSSPSRSTSSGTRVNTSRYGLRSIRCNSPSDIAPAGSSSDSNLNRRKDIAKKRICDGETGSSTGGKKLNGPSSEGRKSSSGLGISISDSRQARSGPLNRDNSAPSVRSRRSLTSYTRARIGNQGSGHNLPPEDDCHVMIPQLPPFDLPFNLNAPNSSHEFSLENSLHRSISYSRSGSSNEILRGIRPSSPAELDNVSSLVNHERGRYNIDGIAEMLLALERIEHDGGLAYEQLLVLEANLFLNGLNFHDQHRDMRLDIDNMSYEELLALEERMGTVSTALSEEELSESLQTSIYHPPHVEDSTIEFGGNKDDVKCSICQEDYVVGDKLGKLKCEHRYHAVCIQQWLRMKNWCPICKASASTASSSSSSSSSSS